MDYSKEYFEEPVGDEQWGGDSSLELKATASKASPTKRKETPIEYNARMERQKGMVAETPAEFAQRKKEVVSLWVSRDAREAARAAQLESTSHPMQEDSKSVIKQVVREKTAKEKYDEDFPPL